jgi:hypothetical protein
MAQKIEPSTTFLESANTALNAIRVDGRFNTSGFSPADSSSSTI